MMAEESLCLSQGLKPVVMTFAGLRFSGGCLNSSWEPLADSQEWGGICTHHQPYNIRIKSHAPFIHMLNHDPVCVKRCCALLHVWRARNCLGSCCVSVVVREV